jgi:N-acetylmuramoyl-L-alanine amidase
MFEALVVALGLQSAGVFAKPPEPWVDPGFAKIIWVDSPNYDPRPEGVQVDTVVLHHTAIDSTLGTVRWFNDPASHVSAHFVIGRDGSIVQQVSCYHRAWHAGVSKDAEGRESVNAFSIGIELVNIGDGTQPYPDEQVEALCRLLTFLKTAFPLKVITSHKAVAQPPGRKIDPIDFPWKRLESLGLKIVP